MVEEKEEYFVFNTKNKVIIISLIYISIRVLFILITSPYTSSYQFGALVAQIFFEVIFIGIGLWLGYRVAILIKYLIQKIRHR